jgi:hypothetical protein
MTHPTCNAGAARWMIWQPKAEKSGCSAKSEPTKPSKPGFVGSVGASSGESAEIGLHRGSVFQQSASPQSKPATECHGGSDLLEPGVDFDPQSTRLMSWAEWKAATLNRLFLEQGRTGKAGRITAETVQHGERAREQKKGIRARKT